MKKFLVIITVLNILFLNTLFAQNEAKIWYFGDGAMLEFFSDMVMQSSGYNLTTEACPGILTNSVSMMFLLGSDGNKLYKDDGGYITEFENGLFGSSPTQPAVIIPNATEDFFYVFTAPSVDSEFNDFYYTVVQDLGTSYDVPSFNISIHSDIAEKMAATEAADGNHWIMVHETGSDNFVALLFGTEIGAPISVTPQAIGPDYGNGTGGDYISGFFKFSPDGTKFASTSPDNDAVFVYDFDIATGFLLNQIEYTIPNAYGIEFSPDNTKLYVTDKDNAEIFQIDLIATSFISIGTDSDIELLGALQLAPDGNIYVGRKNILNSRYLGRIENPNNEMPYYNNEAIDFGLGNKVVNLGLPSFCSSYLIQSEQLEVTWDNACANQEITFTVSDFTNVDYIVWEIGYEEPVTTETPSYTYSGFESPISNPYPISVEVYYEGGASEEINTYINISELSVNFEPIYDICAPYILVPYVYGGSTPYTYNWEETNGNTVVNESSLQIEVLGNYDITLTVTDIEGCYSTTTNTYNVIEGIDLDLGLDTFFCLPIAEQEIILDAGYSSSDYNIYWDTPEGHFFDIQTYPATISGVYSVTVSQNDEPYCTASDDILIGSLYCQDFQPTMFINGTELIEEDFFVATFEHGDNFNIDFSANPNYTTDVCYTQLPEFTTFIWDFGDNTMETITGNGGVVSHLYTELGEYHIRLLVQDNRPDGVEGCYEILEKILVVTENQIINVNSEHETCTGNTITFSTGISDTSTVQYQSVILNTTLDFKNSYSYAIPIPDGDVTNPYTSIITIDEYNGLTIENNSLMEVYIKMEHSNIDDISIELVAPNGTKILLHDTYYLLDPTIMGEPIMNTMGTATDPGVGYTYHFTESSIHDCILNDAIENFYYDGYIDPVGNFYPGRINYIPEGYYTPMEPFENLNGSPINEDWQLIITDSTEYIGYGYVYEWGLKFSPNLYQEACTPTEITWEGDFIIIPNNDSIIDIQPEAEGIFEYTTTLIYEDNYSIDTTVILNVASLELELGNDTTICEGQELILDASENFETYFWSNELNSPTIIITDAGDFSVEVSKGNCFASDTINVAFAQAFAVELGDDIQILQGETITLDAGYFEDAVYLWQPSGETSQDISVSDSGLYVVTVTKQCSVSDSIKVFIVEDINLNLTIPNAFTPNNDGINDTWEVGGIKQYPNTRIQIIDKNGNLQTEYYSDQAETGWDGTYKGRPIKSDTYWYIITFEDGKGITGAVTLKR